jgi:WD40 repeat protein
VVNLKFSPDGRFLAAAMAGDNGGLRIFDRNNDWNEAFQDDAHIYGISFARVGRLATASADSTIRLYEYEPGDIRPSFHAIGNAVQATGGRAYRIAFSPDGSRLAVGFLDRIAVDILDGSTLQSLGGHAPTGLIVPGPAAGVSQTSLGGLSKVAWSIDGFTLFATGSVVDVNGRSIILSWDKNGLGDEHRLPTCGSDIAADVTPLSSGRVFVASMEPCLNLLDANGATVWTGQSQIIHRFGLTGQIVTGYQDDRLKVSQNGLLVDFQYGLSVNEFLRFDVRSLSLSPAPATPSPTRQLTGR